ncbi:MAG: threonine synthase [Pseudomonadota bacterium]
MSNITYQSTRGGEQNLDLTHVLLNGLALDGGLYVPSHLPCFSNQQLCFMRSLDYPHLTQYVIEPFLDSNFKKNLIFDIIDKARDQFDHPAFAPLSMVDRDLWFLELFHGPTLAFKDFGMQMLAGLIEYVLHKDHKKMAIIGATSGDTGSAAIHAFKGSDHIRIFMLHPKNRISPFQRAQMTSVLDQNICNIALKGSFDDCQDLVKAMFNDHHLRQQLSLGAVNSINWGRILAQTIYYFWTGLRLGAPDRPISFVVPSGNFGNIYAGWLARKMGLNIPHLILASNHNDILTRFIKSNDMSIKKVVASMSPSMDIQVSSNFERLLYEILQNDGEATKRHIQTLRASGKLDLDDEKWSFLKSIFMAERVSDPQTLKQIADHYKNTGMIIDPHSATGLATALRYQDKIDHPLVVLATAHAAKFGETVMQAIGISAPRKAAFNGLENKPERVTILENSPSALKKLMLEHVC